MAPRAASAQPHLIPRSLPRRHPQDTFAGRVPLLNAIADASKLLGVADVVSGSEVTGLLGRAIDLIGNVLAG